MKWIILGFFALDRLTKIFALNGVFKLSKNTSLFFLDLNQEWLVWLIGLIIMFLVFQANKVKRQQSRMLGLSYWLIIAGGLSNLFDRVVYGFVVDMIDFFNLSVFNLSDVMIMSGCGLILLITFFDHQKFK